MSARNPFDPSDLSDDQTELDVQSFTSDDDDTDTSAYGSYGFDAPQYGVPPGRCRNAPIRHVAARGLPGRAWDKRVRSFHVRNVRI